MRSFKTTLLLFVCILLVLPGFLVSAAPENGVSATGILAPLNPKATPEAESLLAYLSMVGESDRFVSGTFDISNDNEVYNGIKAQFGKEPALYSARYFVSQQEDFSFGGNTYGFMDFYRVEETNALLKSHYDNGNVLLIHADKPEDALGDYACKTLKISGSSGNLILHLDESNPDRNMELYAAWKDYRTNLISALQALEDSGVKAYLFRPWVEMNSRIFCGIDEAGFAAFRRVFRQTVDALRKSKLVGYLIQFSPASAESSRTDVYYPGNDYVDGIAPTVYAYSGVDGLLSLKQMPDKEWYDRTGKPFGFSELSCRSGDWETMYAEGRASWYNTLITMLTYYPRVSWVNCWGNGAYSLVNTTNGSPAEGNDDGYWFMASDYAITLDKLADYRNTAIAAPGVVQLFREKNYGGNTEETFVSNYTGLEEGTYTYSDLQKLGVDPAAIASFHINRGYALRCYAGDNATGTAWTYLSDAPDASVLRSAGKIRSLQVFTTGNVALGQPEITASDNDDDAWKANNGAYSCWEAVTDENGQGWLMLDMEQPYTVNRWVVRHGGSIGMPDVYNTVDYALEYSWDGSTWQTADAVAGNDCGQTDRVLSALVTARYFRLLITKANRTEGEDKNRIFISEWELYGLPNPGYEVKNGLVQEADGWWYYQNGVRQTVTTLVNDRGGWWHVVDGKVVFDTTLVNYGGNWYYVGGGKVDFNATGLVNYGGTYYFVNKGTVDFKTETLVNYSGSWWHVKGGQVVFDTTLVNYGGAWYYVGGGKVDFNAAGLFNYGGAWWHIKGGKVVFDTTLVNYGGNWYYVGGGKVDFNATGLCNYGGTYYYVNKGVVDFKTETLVNYSGSWWHVKGGKVVFDTTLVKYGNTWYYVQGGKVNFSASGKFNYGGTYYNIKNGVVVF